MKKRWASINNGYSIVELLVIIVVIGILAAITIATYNGIQKRAAASALQNDLSSVKNHMDIVATKTGKYPNFIPEDVKSSEGVTLRIVESAPYSGLTPAQNIQLFRSTCNQLLAEGYGTGTDAGGNPTQYISNCQVHGGGFQITGWHTYPGTVLISENALANWYTANVTPQAWFPDKMQVHQDFAAELTRRHTELGGTFPATTSSGTAPLPAPGAGYVPTEYCVEASHVKYSELLWHVDEAGKIAEGACA